MTPDGRHLEPCSGTTRHLSSSNRPHDPIVIGVERTYREPSPSRAPEATQAGPARPARRRARRPRRDRSQHDRLRARRQAAHRRLRGALPRGAPARRRRDPPGLRLDQGPSRPGRGDRAHPRSRGPHRRRAVPAARARGHPADRVAPDAGPDQGEAQGAPDPPGAAGGQGGRPRPARAVRLRVPRRQPLDPRRSRRRHPDQGRPGPAHRRLQDGPVPAGQADHRPARLRAARRGGRRPLPDRLDQRRGPRASPPPRRSWPPRSSRSSAPRRAG